TSIWGAVGSSATPTATSSWPTMPACHTPCASATNHPARRSPRTACPTPPASPPCSPRISPPCSAGQRPAKTHGVTAPVYKPATNRTPPSPLHPARDGASNELRHAQVHRHHRPRGPRPAHHPQQDVLRLRGGLWRGA